MDFESISLAARTQCQMQVIQSLHILAVCGRMHGSFYVISVHAECLPSARLAQSVERKALNLVVVGSSPTVGVTWCWCAGVVAENGGTHRVVSMLVMYGCMYLCLSACMHACMHACILVRRHACRHVCMRVCMHACMHAYLHGCMYVGMHARVCSHVRMDVCTCACTHTCM